MAILDFNDAELSEGHDYLSVRSFLAGHLNETREQVVETGFGFLGFDVANECDGA